MKSKWMLAAAAAGLLAVCWAGGVATASLPAARDSIATGQGAGAARERTTTETLPMQPGSAICVDNELGAITVEGWDRPEVQLVTTRRVASGGFLGMLTGDWLSRAAINKLLDAADPDMHYGEGSLRLYVRREEREHPVRVSVHLRVPRESALHLRAEQGRVTVSDITGTVEATSGNGALALNRVTGDIYLRSHNGHVQLAAVDGSIHAQTRNGRIVCEDAHGTLRLRSQNGAIDARRNYASTLDCHTENGSIAIALPAETGVALDAATRSGNVRCITPLDDAAYETQGRLQATVRGGGGMHALRSTHGSITITQD